MSSPSDDEDVLPDADAVNLEATLNEDIVTVSFCMMIIEHSLLVDCFISLLLYTHDPVAIAAWLLLKRILSFL